MELKDKKLEMLRTIEMLQARPGMSRNDLVDFLLRLDSDELKEILTTYKARLVREINPGKIKPHFPQYHKGKNQVEVLTVKDKKLEGNDDTLLSVEEVAELFDVSPQAVYKWIKKKKIKFIPPSPGGRGILIPRGQFNLLDKNFTKRAQRELIKGAQDIRVTDQSDLYES